MTLRFPCWWAVLAAVCVAACAGRSPAPATPKPAATPAPAAPAAPADGSRATPEQAEPIVPPPLALLAGLMPLGATGVDQFRTAHPTYDGRGVIIGILDSGVDPGVAGLITTTTGAPKLLDLRDFSGEGRIVLTPVTPTGDGVVTVAGKQLVGAGRIARLATGARWYAGVFRELPLGKLPAADVNGDGDNTDEFPVVVVKAMDGWVAFLDTNLNGSLEDETPLHDYRQGRETIALGRRPLTIAANFTDSAGAPILDLVFDTSGHGTHVAGIAAGHNLYNVQGFDGVAPGAQLLALKIANNARGGISVNGSMVRAMEYAARFAAQRNLPLVLNMSFGVGNEQEGRALIDSLINGFLAAHPDVVFAISAGNDGPGLSTMGFPGSADLALSVGALYPGVFSRPPQPGVPPAPDALAWFSSRGGDSDKPDLLAPGVAFSSVPRWNTGDEIKGGTSMAAPHATGLAACLVSAMTQEGRRPGAAEVMQALRVSATPIAGTTVLDAGAGVPKLEAAYRWLAAGHQGAVYVVRTPNGSSAAFRRDGLAGPGDTVQSFHVAPAMGFRAAQLDLRSDAAWLSVPAQIRAGAPATDIAVAYRGASFAAPGVYVGTVTARNPSDTLSGPLFELVNAIVVPYDLPTRPLSDPRHAVAAGRVQRYFLRVPAVGSTLHATVSLADSTQHAFAKLYEPDGRPFRDAPDDISVGGADGGTADVVVRAEDLVAGVYELDVVAPPLAAVTADVRAAIAAVTLARTGHGLEAGDAGSETVAGRVTSQLIGAEAAFAVEGRGLPAESLTVRVPAWAARAEVDVEMPREQWNRFTDFGVTVFDSSGQQVNEGPMNYAVARQRFAVPEELAGQALTVELFPASAQVGPVPAWRATVRVRFLLKTPRPAQAGKDVTVVAGGRSTLELAATPPLQAPAGFQPLVEVRVTPPGGDAAILRATLEHP